MRLKKTTTTETTWTIKREPLFNRNPLAVSSDCCWCCAVVGQRCMHELFKEKDIKSKYTHTHTQTNMHTRTPRARVCIYEHIFFMCISLDFVLAADEGWRRAWVIGSFYCRLVYFNFADASPVSIALVLVIVPLLHVLLAPAPLFAVVVVVVDEANFNE